SAVISFWACPAGRSAPKLPLSVSVAPVRTPTIETPSSNADATSTAHRKRYTKRPQRANTATHNTSRGNTIRRQPASSLGLAQLPFDALQHRLRLGDERVHLPLLFSQDHRITGGAACIDSHENRHRPRVALAARRRCEAELPPHAG